MVIYYIYFTPALGVYNTYMVFNKIEAETEILYRRYASRFSYWNGAVSKKPDTVVDTVYIDCVYRDSIYILI